jgi:2-polyprenyl-6-methoxyphenol hydroxylase-like FAD-dependent oxidoreductase
MRVAIIGAGPSGLYLALALARRSHSVEVIDRDPGPTGESWRRRGVMQFDHPHAFRTQVCDALLAEVPEVFDALLAAGAEIGTVAELPGVMISLRCRRATFERVLRGAAQAQFGITFRVGHVEEIVAERGRVSGVTVDGHQVDAELVLDASGRAGRLSDRRRAASEGGDCGFAFVSRQYRLRPGADPGPINAPIGYAATYTGYLAFVFTHELGTFSTLIQRATADCELAALRGEAAFEAAARAIPQLAAWTDPQRSRPLGPVLPGAGLHNAYRGQLDSSGRLAMPGLICVGDTVCTTNPVGGRGVATSLMQAQRLIALIDAHRTDLAACALAFDQWCTDNIKPWFDDHVYTDTQRLRRWAGHDVDLAAPLPSDLICAAAEAVPEFWRVVGPYQAMNSQPSSLGSIEVEARALYRTGWRPTEPEGPTRAELAEVIRSAHQPPRGDHGPVANSGRHPNSRSNDD